MPSSDAAASRRDWSRFNILGLVRRLMAHGGVDRAVGFTVLQRGIQILSGPVTILLLARGLTPVEQGFYYTFASVLAMQIFFELGLEMVIVQFASHEKPLLHWTPDGRLEGEPTAKARLSALLTSAVRWYAVAALLLVVALIPAGLLFFGRASHQLPTGSWRLAWVCLVVTTSLRLMATPVFAVLEGCGLIAQVASVRLRQDLVGYPVLWTALLFGAGLFSSVLSQSAYVVMTYGWFALRKRAFVRDLIVRQVQGGTLSWRRELWPLQWRIAVSWLSGYFIFQLFNPVAFMFLGAAAAGRMGMGLVVANAISTVSMAWVSTRAPTLGQLIARREWAELDALFFRSLKQALGVSVAVSAAGLAVVAFLRAGGYTLGRRMLEPLPLLLLVGGAIANVYVFSLATYLRAHKREPLLAISLAGALATGASTYLLGRSHGLVGMSAGYLATTLLFGVIGISWIFVLKRREWHR